MKQKLKKAKQWASENKLVVAWVVLCVGVGGILITSKWPKSKPLTAMESDYIDSFARFMDMESASQWSHVGTGRNTYKISDLGTYGEHLLKSMH